MEKMRKLLSILLCLCMLLQNCPVMAFAAATDNLCEHHTEHTAECGYREGSAGSACTHAHSEECYAILECLHTCGDECANGCTHECSVENGCIIMELDCHHTHGDCGFSEAAAEVPCGHTHNESCGYVQAVAGTPCANAGTDPECDHSGDCGFVAAVEGAVCGHVEHTDCGYVPATEGAPCTHVCEVLVDSDDSCYKLLCSHAEGGHDDTCGYVETVEAHECHYECAECAAALTADETTEPSAEATTEPSTEATEPAPVCDCGTDDPAIHAVSCPVYVAPENPQCFCVEKCAEANVWCDVCGFDYTACAGGWDEGADYASTPTYIASIGVAQDGSSGSTGVNDCKNELSGHIIIDRDLNDGAGGDYVYMGYKTTTDPSQAITGIVFRVGENPPDAIIHDNRSFYLVGGAYEPNTAKLGGYIDLNARAGGVYIYTYVARGDNRSPITALTVNGSSSYSGWSTGTNTDGNVIDLNQQARGDYLYLHYQTFQATINANYYVYRNGQSVVEKKEWTIYHPTEEKSSNPLVNAVTTTYDGRKFHHTGWRTDTTAAAPTLGFFDGKVSYATSGKNFYAVYTQGQGAAYDPLKLSYNANGGTGVPATQEARQYINAGSNGVVAQKVSFTVPAAIPTHPDKCVFQGWSTSSSATTATYQPGNTVTIDKNTTLYAVYKNHADNNNDGFCDNNCGASMDAPTQSGGVYQITNKAELIWFMQHVNKGNKSANAIVLNNIDMSGYAWTPIASTGLYYDTTTYADKGYTGTFNGNNKVISNLTLTGSSAADASFGLFGTVSGTVKNLGIQNFKYTGAGKDSRVGAVVGQMLPGSKVENCYVNGVNINTKVNTTSGVAGGIAGCNYSGTITGSYTYNVTISAGRFGGIVGDNRGDISNSDRKGTLQNCYTNFSSVHSERSGNATNCGTLTDTQFASGEATWKLNGNTASGIWKQTVGTGLPAFSGLTVYQVNRCDNKTITYSNSSTSPQSHTYVDGVCSFCGAYMDGVVAAVSHNGVTTGAYTNLADAITAVADTTADDNAVVTLLQKIDLTKEQNITSGVFTLDLNGQTLTGSGQYVLYFWSGTVTITDSGENGTIQSTNTDSNEGMVYIDDGTVNIVGGTICGSKDGNKNNIGVEIVKGTLTLSGGKVTGSSYGVKNDRGTVKITGSAAIEDSDRGVITYGGSLEIGGNAVIRGSDDGLVISGGNVHVTGGSITGSHGGVTVNSGTVTISSGEITGRSSGVSASTNTSVTITGGSITANYGVDVYKGTATISGGTITGREYDIYDSGNGTITLTLAEGKTEGATFPGGIRVRDTTLNEILTEGAGYWQGGKQVLHAENATAITGGDVVIKKACPHTGSKTYTNNSTNHSWICADCQNAFTEPHAYDETTLLCVCGAARADAVALVSREGKADMAYATLAEAITAVENCVAEDEAVVKLLQNINLGDGYQKVEYGVFTLDLNGKLLESENESSEATIDIPNVTTGNRQLTIRDSDPNKQGQIKGRVAAVRSYGGALIIESGIFSGVDCAVHSLRGTVVIHDGTFTATYAYAVYCYGGKLTINNGKFSALDEAKSAVCIDDNLTTINGGTFTGKYVGLSTWGTKVVTVNGGTFTAGSPVFACAGSTIITGGTFTGSTEDIARAVTLTLAEGKTEGAFFPGGMKVDVGSTLSDVLGEGMGYWQGGKQILPADDAKEITGGDVVIKKACAHDGEKTYTDNGTTHSWTCDDCQNTFTEDHVFDPDSLLCICGTVDPSANAVALVTGYGEPMSAYTTLADAIAVVQNCAAEEEAGVKLLQDIDLGKSYQTITSGVFTLDLNGQTLTGGAYTVLKITGGTVTIDDSGENGTIQSTYAIYQAITVDIEGRNATLTVSGGIIRGNANSMGSYGVELDYGTLKITGGSISGGHYGMDVYNGTVEISGGEIIGKLNGVVLTDGILKISGGSITGNDGHDIYDERDSTITLTLAEGKTEGATFPGGLTVYGTTLSEILAEGAAYWQGGKQIIPADGATAISDGDVVIKKACAHDGKLEYVNITNATHDVVCMLCSGTIATGVPHDFTGGNGCDCGKVKTVAVIGGRNYNKLSVEEAVYGQDLEVTLTIDKGFRTKLEYVEIQNTYYEDEELQIFNPVWSADNRSVTLTIPGEYVIDDIIVSAFSAVALRIHANGGTCTDSTVPDPFVVDLFYGNGIYLDEYVPQYTREGYLLLGLNTKPDGSGENYDPTYQIYMDQDLDLYLNWELDVPPAIKGAIVTRQGEQAQVDLIMTEEGVYYYAMVASGAEHPAIDTTGDGTEYYDSISLSLTELETGAYELFFVFKDEGGLISEPVKVEIPAVDTYPIFVGGVQVTTDNRTDILGNGTAAYDPAAGTLTLNGFRYTGEGTPIVYDGSDDTSHALIYSRVPLEVKLEGENVIESRTEGNTAVDGIHFTTNGANISFTGTGSLRIVTNGDGIEVVDSGDLNVTFTDSVKITEEATLEGVDLDADIITMTVEKDASIDYNGHEEGIYLHAYEYGKLTIQDSANVRMVTDDEEGIYIGGYDQILNITGGTVYAKSDKEALDAGTIHISGGNITAISIREEYEGIYADDLTISGGIVHAVSVNYDGIGVNNSFALSGGCVTTKGNSEYDCHGVYSYSGDLTITGGRLEVLDGGIVVGGTIALDGVGIVTPANGQVSENEDGYRFVADETGDFADAVVITADIYLGWIEIEGDWYYYDPETGKPVADIAYLTKGEGDEAVIGWYAFDHETGKWLEDTDGFYTAQNGDLYYIEKGLAVKNKGLVQVEDPDCENGHLYYYFGCGVEGCSADPCCGEYIAQKNNRHWAAITNGYLMECGYTTGDDGVIEHIDDTTYEGIYEINGVKFYLMDGVKVHKGLFKLGDDYYYARSNGALVVGQTYWVSANKLNGFDLKAGSYKFDEEGRIDFSKKNGFYEEDGVWYYYEDGKLCYKGLYWFDGTAQEDWEAGPTLNDPGYYYINSSAKLIVNRDYWISKNNGYMKNQSYSFDENGTMYEKVVEKKNGFYLEDGNYYYYEDDVKTYAGLIWCDGPEGNDPGYYYVNSSAKLIVNCDYWISKNNGYMKNQRYSFDENGTMYEKVVEKKNGFYLEDGNYYYYEDDVKTYAGLIWCDGPNGNAPGYYYVNSSAKLITGCNYWISKNNGYMKNGSYTFDENGLMLNPAN